MIVSEPSASTDTVQKLPRYHQPGIPHFWLVDPRRMTLTVYQHQPEGYLNVLVAEKGERVRAEPFDAIELRVGILVGEDPDDDPAQSTAQRAKSAPTPIAATTPRCSVPSARGR